MISRSFPLHLVIRLLCLYSLVNDGVKARQYDSFKKQIIQTYGFKHLLTLKALEKTNLLKCQDPVSLSSAISKSTYPSLRRSLRLIVDDVDEHDPSDVAYVYSGFAPISIRLVQIAVSKSVNGPGTTNTFGWKGWDDVLKLLPGPSIDETQKAIGDVESRNAVKTCLVVFIGGCTFTEIASLRFLGMQSLDKSPREYIVVTTNITNGSGLIKSLIQE